MMLQSNRASFCHSWHLCIFNRFVSVQFPSQTILDNGDLEPIPLPYMTFGVPSSGNPCTNFCRKAAVHSVTVTLNGPNRPAPYVYLRLRHTSEIDTWIG